MRVRVIKDVSNNDWFYGFYAGPMSNRDEE
jgi:hypothetical protein